MTKTFSFGLEHKCRKIKLLEEHLNRLVRDPQYVYNEKEAEKPIIFIQNNLEHYQDPFSGPIILETWQKEMIRAIFGLYYKDDENRRLIKDTFLFIGRKNGKTNLAACLLTYVFVAEGKGLKIYLAASKREQAMLAFKDISTFIQNNQKLSKNVNTFYNRIEFPLLRNTIQPITSNAHRGSGLNCKSFFADEVHEHSSADLINILKTSQGARQNVINFYASTAGAARFGPCFDMYKLGEDLLEQKIKQDNFLPVIFEADEEDDPMSLEAFCKANPNYGVSINKHYFQEQTEKCKNEPHYIPSYLRFHLNKWVAVSEKRWFNINTLNSVYSDYDIDDISPEESNTYVGIDLSTNKDLSAIAILVEKEGKYYFDIKHFLPEEIVDPLQKETGIPYREWVTNGFLTATPGDTIDTRIIFEEIKRIHNSRNINHICFDPAFAYDLTPSIQEEGIDISKFKQTYQEYNYSCIELENRINSKRILIPKNELIKWQFENIKIHIQGNLLRKPHKNVNGNRSDKIKIDGVCALLFAIEAERRYKLDQQEQKGKGKNNCFVENTNQVDILKKLFSGF
jgi:phage terminase large subunit-like protein